MTIYGADFYGASTSLYGEAGQLPFDASPFTSRSWFPGLVELFWSMPTGNWTRLRLVRSTKGYPAHEDDGGVVFDINCGPSSDAFDSGFTYFADVALTGDRWYQYALFVYSLDDLDWAVTGYTDVLVVADHQSTQHMRNKLPSVFTTVPRNAGQGQADEDAPMARFSGLFGFQLDTIRTFYESLLHLHDPELVPTRVLQLLCSELGVPYEPQIGAAHTRVLLNNAMHIHKTKGTRIGIEAFTSSLTGWPCSLIQGINLMLDYNDSSAEESIGNWTPRTLCTLARVLPAVVSPYQADANLAAGAFALTSTGAGTCEAHCGNALTHGTIKSGVPINGGTAYTLSAYIQAAATPLVNAIGLVWFDWQGVFISTTLGSNFTNSVATWTRATATGNAPTNAQFCAPFIRVTATGGSQVAYFDAIQLEANGSASTFQEARQLQIALGADRVNEVLNPSFETDTTNWATTASATAAASTSMTLITTDTAPIPGFNSVQVAAPGVAVNEGITTVLTDMLPGSDYIVSIYVEPISGSGVIVRVKDVTNAGAIIQSVSAPISSGWVRLSLTMTTGITPPNISVSVTTDGTGPLASVFRVDGILIERGITLRDYFDGAAAGDHPSDHVWGGTPNDSRSYLYRDYVTKLLRLTELLPDYLWPGMTFAFPVAEDLRGFGRAHFGEGEFGT